MKMIDTRKNSSSLASRESTTPLQRCARTQLLQPVPMLKWQSRCSPCPSSKGSSLSLLRYSPKSLTPNRKVIMFILKSIVNQAGAVWVVESIAMRKIDAERLLRRRQAQNDGSRRYGLFPAK